MLRRGGGGLALLRGTPLRLFLLALPCKCHGLPTLYQFFNPNIDLPDLVISFLGVLLLLCPPASSERQVLELLPADREAQGRWELWRLSMCTAGAAPDEKSGVELRGGLHRGWQVVRVLCLAPTRCRAANLAPGLAWQLCWGSSEPLEPPLRRLS